MLQWLRARIHKILPRWYSKMFEYKSFYKHVENNVQYLALFCNMQQTQYLCRNVVTHVPNTSGLNYTFKGKLENRMKLAVFETLSWKLKLFMACILSLHVLLWFFAYSYFPYFPYLIHSLDSGVWIRRQATASLSHLLQIKRGHQYCGKEEHFTCIYVLTSLFCRRRLVL